MDQTEIMKLIGQEWQKSEKKRSLIASEITRIFQNSLAKMIEESPDQAQYLFQCLGQQINSRQHNGCIGISSENFLLNVHHIAWISTSKNDWPLHNINRILLWIALFLYAVLFSIITEIQNDLISITV